MPSKFPPALFLFCCVLCGALVGLLPGIAPLVGCAPAPAAQAPSVPVSPLTLVAEASEDFRTLRVYKLDYEGRSYLVFTRSGETPVAVVLHQPAVEALDQTPPTTVKEP